MKRTDSYYRPVSRHWDSQAQLATSNAILEAQASLRDVLLHLLSTKQSWDVQAIGPIVPHLVATYQHLQATQRLIGT